MISNAEELAAWLSSVRGGQALPSEIKWRPSRAARGFVFVDQVEADRGHAEMKRALENETKAKTLRRDARLGWIAGLSGPWTTEDNDYAVAALPINAELTLKRSRKGEVSLEFTSWKNSTGRKLAALFAKKGMPAIDFILSSRHHAFGQAVEALDTDFPEAIFDGQLPELVEAQLAVADAELGIPTELRRLLRHGIAVHTAAMLQVEQAAAEWMFACGHAKLMFATGTLAQGLNLPAIAVVVSGSQLAGGPQALRDADAAAGLTRANELILNGFGRAGRPGFSNQGVVALVSDRPFKAKIVDNLDSAQVLEDYPVLGEPDASVSIQSPIQSFLDNLVLHANDEAIRFQLVAHLAAFEGDENAGTILKRTFGGYQKRQTFRDAQAAKATARVAALKRKFLEGNEVPTWMPTVAMKAGVSFFRAHDMWRTYRSCSPLSVEQLPTLSVMDWLDALFNVLSHMPIESVRDYMDDKKTETPRTRLHILAEDVPPSDLVPWPQPAGWQKAWKDLSQVVLAHTTGLTYVEIGVRLTGRTADSFTSQRADGARGLPPVFKFVGGLIERTLAIDAGCFLALHEAWLEAEHPEVAVPEAVAALPLCVRNGCDSLDALAWFRGGFRQRVCAHALARAFPIPAEVTTDEGRLGFVRKARLKWLDMDQTDAEPLLRFARTIVVEGSSERS